MGFQDIVVRGQWRSRYKKLTSTEDEMVARPRKQWVTSMNGKFRGFRVSRRLNWKAFSVVVSPRKIAAGIYADVVNRMKMDDSCPGIIFSGQWGLPVLSHSNAKCRRVISLSRNR